MAYADGNCDDTEKDLLQFVFGELEIEDESILMELEDTAETLLAIEAKKQFAQNITKCSMAERIRKECKTERESVVASIKALTLEGDD